LPNQLGLFAEDSCGLRKLFVRSRALRSYATLARFVSVGNLSSESPCFCSKFNRSLADFSPPLLSRFLLHMREGLHGRSHSPFWAHLRFCRTEDKRPRSERPWDPPPLPFDPLHLPCMTFGPPLSFSRFPDAEDPPGRFVTREGAPSFKEVSEIRCRFFHAAFFFSA